MELHAVEHVVARRAPRQQARLLEHHGAVAARPVDGLAGDLDAPGVERQQARDDVEERGLAAAGRPDDAHELAVLDRQRHVVQRGDRIGLALHPEVFRDAMRGELVHISPHLNAAARLAAISAFTPGPNSPSMKPLSTRRSTKLWSMAPRELERGELGRLRLAARDDARDRAGRHIGHALQRPVGKAVVIHALDQLALCLDVLAECGNGECLVVVEPLDAFQVRP